ncbi:MAG: glutamine--fructose-6-phosphate transaminase (isomerizing) [Lentisphaerae bacterium]|nr:glutamine--fructose-6-phosphate transaminase (isomerizing) [Lentisphaerota bacterium]
MCGIVGYTGGADVGAILVSGLRRLEYRGYDSAGIALHAADDTELTVVKTSGKVADLEACMRVELDPAKSFGRMGIGHTRWATHGVPNEANAHPHATKSVAVVHNGIIENFQGLRDELSAAGHELASDTDTEVVAHLITLNLEQGMDPALATKTALARLEGAFALGIVFAGENDLMIAARRGSPLAIGIGDKDGGEMYLGSDALALAPLTDQIMYLEDGDWAVIRTGGVEVFDEDGHEVSRDIKTTELTGDAIEKGGYAHFMLKEIYEQPQVIGDTLHSFVNQATRSVTMPDLGFDPAKVSKFTLIACGSSYYACMVAKYWLESLARVPVEVDIASEFRYRGADMPAGGVAIFVSQSGETADTLAALRYAKGQGQKILSIVNVPESTIARESDAVLHTNAGPEVGVASTKALTTQITVLGCLVLAVGRARGAIDADTEARLVDALIEVPARAAEVLNHDERLRELAQEIALAPDVLYLGRGTSYPVALEGALKLKEISYIHAEGYAAGEMKHGPIALIDEGVPVIVIAPTDDLFEKTASNMAEVMARNGRVIFFSDATGAKRLGDKTTATIALPDVDPFVAPILYIIAVQLLAYHTAVIKGTDVDQPRNLAKSVTVE